MKHGPYFPALALGRSLGALAHPFVRGRSVLRAYRYPASESAPGVEYGGEVCWPGGTPGVCAAAAAASALRGPFPCRAAAAPGGAVTRAGRRAAPAAAAVPRTAAA